jgi:hypothetical protein
MGNMGFGDTHGYTISKRHPRIGEHVDGKCPAL